MLNEWLNFTDRSTSPYNPTADTRIVTNRFFVEEFNDFSEEGKIREEWSIRSVLVSCDDITTALDSISFHDTNIRPGWLSSGDFNFGEIAIVDNIELFPWVFIWESPLDAKLTIKIRADFLNYHCLVETDENRYIHPLDELSVIEAKIETISFFNPSARVDVYVDYLRDYLSARKMALLISIVADRFANAPSVEELGIVPKENDRIDMNTYITCVIQDPGSLNDDYYCGRSSLYRNVAIEPYDQPRVDRTPWYYFGEIPEQLQRSATFIIDEAGNRAPLDEPRCPKYLYFKPSVLSKYLESKYHKVNFHMRNWGAAQDLDSKATIDLGINSKGLVTAFAPDLGKLKPNEQLYWASFSSMPDGEVCEELYQTRMQNNPPESKSVVDDIAESLSKLNSSFSEHFAERLYDGALPSASDAAKMNVGPLGSDLRQFVRLGQSLYQSVVEIIPISVLRKPVEHLQSFSKDWKQIKLLEEIAKFKTNDHERSRKVTDPLRGLNIIRIGSAHTGTVKMDEAFSLLGYPSIPVNPRDAWQKCVASICSSLVELSLMFDS